MSLKFRPIRKAIHDYFKDSECSSDPRLGLTWPLYPQPTIRFKPKKRDSQAENLKRTQEMLDLCAKNVSDSPLLRLPLDIRQRIYEYVFSTGEVIELLPWDARLERGPIAKPKPKEEEQEKESAGGMDIDDDYVLISGDLTNKETKKRNAPTRSFVSVLTCRQFYLETHLLPFSCNTIHCCNMWDLLVILGRLSPAQRSSIRTLKIRWATARSAVWENAQPAGSLSTVGRVLKMLDGLEKVIVNRRGCLRNGLEWTVMEALWAACGRKVDIWFEGAVQRRLVPPRPFGSSCNLVMGKWKCVHGRRKSVCRSGEC